MDAAAPPKIRHLAALAATVRHGSLTRAAVAVNLTQPALTQAIAGLETALGATLFDRGPSGMTATPAARLLAPRAEAAVAHIGSTRVTGTQMRAFIALARAGSFAGASAATGLAPASLHRAVADLSVALGQRLVERRGKAVVLTAAGQRRARAFGLAMAEYRAGLAEIAELQGRKGGRIVIGAMPLSRARWLPDAIIRFAATHPEIDIAIHEGSYTELAAPLRDGEIDLLLGALREGGQADDLTQEPVFDDAPSIVMRAGHPLAGGTNLVERIADHPWILPGRETPLRQYWEAMMRELGSKPDRVAIECGSVMTIRQLLVKSDGLSLLSVDQVALEVQAGILTTCSPPVPVKRTIGIVTRTGWRPTGAQQTMLSLLRGFNSRA